MAGVYGTIGAMSIIAMTVVAVVIMSNAVTWANNVTTAPNLYVQMSPTMGYESNYLGDSMQNQYMNVHYYATFTLSSDSGSPLMNPSVTFAASENGWYPNDMYVIYSINGGGWNTLPMGSGYWTQSCTLDLSGYSIYSMSSLTINFDVVYSASAYYSWSATLNGSI